MCTEPPPSEKTLKDWMSFVKWHEKLPFDPTHELRFRGQADASWCLEPKLFREAKKLGCQDKPQLVLEAESHALGDFATRKHFFGEEYDETPYGGLALMQHYGVPTRLLDWSANAFKALYFAVDHLWEGKEGKDGALWVLDKTVVEQAMRRRYPRKAAQIGSHFGDLPRDRQWSVEPVFLLYRKTKFSQRVYDQEGWFSITKTFMENHDVVLRDLLPPKEFTGACWKLVIPAAQKPDFMRHLGEMRVNPESLFRCKDGIGRGVMDNLRLHLEGRRMVPRR